MLSVLRPFPSPLLSRHGIDLDFPLLAGCLALLGLGLVMVTSAFPRWRRRSRATRCTSPSVT